MADHPHLEEYKRNVKCDGIIYILKGDEGIIKKKPRAWMTVDLRYVATEDLFVDNDNIVYERVITTAAVTTRSTPPLDAGENLAWRPVKSSDKRDSCQMTNPLKRARRANDGEC